MISNVADDNGIAFLSWKSWDEGILDMKFCWEATLLGVSMLVLCLHLALTLLHQHHHLDHGGQSSAIQLQVHSGELGRQAVGAEGVGVLRSSRKMNRPTFSEAKIVLYNCFLAIFVGNCLAEGHCSTGLPMYFMAFDGQDDPLRGWAHSEHEVVPEFLGFFPKRRFLPWHPILQPSEALGLG